MGLGAPKKRSKLSTDPNNTAWTKNTTNFGHRILSSQGWQPGQYLGAKDAAHQEHYTAANASHIRVLLREDNLGIGAQVGGNGRAETFGLATLSGIFGRLNGKSDGEVQKQQEGLRDAELRSYQGMKYGHMNFVYGGLLVGDKMEEGLLKDIAKASKKRKAEEEAENDSEKTLKRKKGEENLRAEAEVESASSSSSSDESERTLKKKAKKEKKERKEKKRKATASSDSDEESEDAKRQRKEARRKAKREAAGQDSSAEKSETKEEKTRRKAEKHARKEEKRKRKEEKRRLKSEKASAASTSASNTPVTGNSTPIFGGSRHAVRQRYIQQKRMASMDPQALKEILMLKAQG